MRLISTFLSAKIRMEQCSQNVYNNDVQLVPFVFHFPPRSSISKSNSSLDWPPTLLNFNSPFRLKTSLRFINTSANHRTSLTNCITYSGSIPGAPARWDVRPMLLSELRFLEVQPMFQDLTDPDDRDPV